MTQFQRTSTTSVVFASYNLLLFDLTTNDTTELARLERVIAVIRSLDADVLAVQEIIAGHPDPTVKASIADDTLRQLADAVGMNCVLPDDTAAVGVGSNNRFHTGLLWRDGIHPAGPHRVYTGGDVYHSLIRIPLDVGGRIISHASYHATPFGRYRRTDEAERVTAIMTRPDRPGRPDDRPPGLIGADWNGISADRVWRPDAPTDSGEPGRWELYDPDPYQHQPAYGDLVYQTRWTTDDRGQASYWAHREPGEVLYRGGLRDVAAALDAPWQPTTGHWFDDPYGPRRIDTTRATPDVVTALRRAAVISQPIPTGQQAAADPATASDHYPFLTEYEPADITDRTNHTVAQGAQAEPDNTMRAGT